MDVTTNENFEAYNDAPESCFMCGGQKFVLGALGNMEHLQCRDCGHHSCRPIVNGVRMTSQEEDLDE